jgi:16S rRNA (guanine966-N2)-methyltransferase
MRIISGRWRRRTILAPEGRTTRPMPDRVRMAIFETVGSWLGTPSSLPPIRVLDLFAGSGSIGLEALSRGAAWCCFVERDRTAVATLRRSIATLLEDHAGERAQVLIADVFNVSRWCRPVRQTPFELVFVDPPYDDSHQATPAGKVALLLTSLSDASLLADDALVVLRHEARVSYDHRRYGRLRPTDVRRYGSMSVTYLIQSR